MEKYCNIKLTVGEVDLVLDALELIQDKKVTRDIKTELQRAKIKSGWDE